MDQKWQDGLEDTESKPWSQSKWDCYCISIAIQIWKTNLPRMTHNKTRAGCNAGLMNTEQCHIKIIWVSMLLKCQCRICNSAKWENRSKVQILVQVNYSRKPSLLMEEFTPQKHKYLTQHQTQTECKEKTDWVCAERMSFISFIIQFWMHGSLVFSSHS